MDVFQINQQDDRLIELTVKNYEYNTRKTDPFYVEVNKEMKYYAICPACKNPIIIVNLYVDKTLDENKNKMPIHAKHCKYSVTNLAQYSQEAYDECPLGNPSKFGGSSMHRSKKKRNEIVALIKYYPVVLYDEIKNITGIDFSEKTFSSMISSFIKAEGYYYKYINKYNLPYGFLNMQKSIIIYNTKLYYSPFKSEMINCINNSEFFQYKNYRITPKLKDGFYEIELYLANHKIDTEYERETIDIIIVEKSNGKTNEVFNKTVKIDIEKYINKVDKHRRINNITEVIEVDDEYFAKKE